MKFLGLNLFGSSKKQGPIIIQNEGVKLAGFSAPFGPIGEGNLSLPYISNQYRYGSGYVPFAAGDNLYPNLLRQLYHTSPIHNAIVNYKVNAVVGGGYEILNGQENAQNKIKQYAFETKNKLSRLVKHITKDAIVFESIILLIENDNNGIAKSIKRLPQDEIRWDENMTKFHWNKDYSRTNTATKIYDKYQIGKPNHEGVIVFRFDDGDLIYPLPNYATANHWIALDGEIGLLHKNNILNSIYPSAVFKFPRKPESDEELNFYKNLIDGAKGAAAAGKIITFFENGSENLPTIETISANNNDKLFEQTDQQIDLKVSEAHGVDELLLGIRVAGKLGSGEEIKFAYTIFEKQHVMPLRSEIEEIVNFLLDISKIQGTFKFNNYQIIDNVITQKKEIL